MSELPKLEPCPFCGGVPQVTKHFKHELFGLVHRCPSLGAIVMDFAEAGVNEDKWNRRHLSTLTRERDAMREAAKLVEDLPELNPSNYSHDDVCELNARVVEVILAFRRALAGGEVPQS